eukprot:7084011-Pyramimonas_sp.AAC.1
MRPQVRELVWECEPARVRGGAAVHPLRDRLPRGADKPPGPPHGAGAASADGQERHWNGRHHGAAHREAIRARVRACDVLRHGGVRS